MKKEKKDKEKNIEGYLEEATFNRKEAELFLNYLDSDSNEFTFQCFHPDRKIKPTKPFHGSLAEWYEALIRYNKDGFGIYVTINETDGTGRKIKNIKNIRAIWQEDDDNFKGKLPFKPDLIVNTSKGKYHRYLLTEKTSTKIIDKDSFDSIQLRLVQDYGSDKNARDITRVLRLPGFYNTKPNLKKPHLVTIDLAKSKDITKIKRKPWKKICKNIKPISNRRKKEKGKEKSGDSSIWEKQVNYSDGEAIEAIANAEEYYQPLLSWAMILANKGLNVLQIQTILEQGMYLGKAKRSNQDMDVWQERFDGIKQQVESAVEKVEEEKEFKNPFAPLKGKEIMKEDIPDTVFWLNPFIAKSSFNMVHAARGLGKTYFTLSMAVAVSKNKYFLGRSTKKNAKVLYLDGELPYNLLQKQIKIACETVNVNPRELPVEFLTIDKMPNNVFPDLTVELNQKHLEEKIMEGGFNFIIFDNLATIFKTAEENQQSWGSVRDWLGSLRTKGITSIIIHHDNKAGDAQRGFSNKEDTMDTVFHLKKPRNMKDTDGAKFNVAFTKHRHFNGIESKSFGCKLVSRDDNDKKIKPFWEFGEIHGSQLELVVECLNNGLTGVEIAKELNIATSRVSRLRKQAIEQRLLSDVGLSSDGRRKERFDKKGYKGKKKKKNE